MKRDENFKIVIFAIKKLSFDALFDGEFDSAISSFGVACLTLAGPGGAFFDPPGEYLR